MPEEPQECGFSPRALHGQISGFAMRSSGGCGKATCIRPPAVYIAPRISGAGPNVRSRMSQVGEPEIRGGGPARQASSPYQPGSQPGRRLERFHSAYAVHRGTPVTEMYGCIAQKRGMPWAALCAIGRALEPALWMAPKNAGCELAAAFLGVLKPASGHFSRRRWVPGLHRRRKERAAPGGSRQL